MSTFIQFSNVPGVRTWQNASPSLKFGEHCRCKRQSFSWTVFVLEQEVPPTLYLLHMNNTDSFSASLPVGIGYVLLFRAILGNGSRDSGTWNGVGFLICRASEKLGKIVVLMA